MQELIEKARQGDGKAFAELMQNHMQSMYKVAKAIIWSDEDIADVIQDTIFSCWRNLGKLKEPKYFKTWMTRILVNHCKDHIKNQMSHLSEDLLSEVGAKDSTLENIEWKETLKLLDERYRLVMILYYVEGFCTSEIGKILDIPEATVRTRLARGREKLAKMYGDSNGRRVL